MRGWRNGRSIGAAAAVVLAGIAAACGSGTATPTVPPASDAGYTEMPLVATPWPNGTVGKYGLRVDPALMKLVPATVGGLPLVESPDYEASALDSQAAAQTTDSIAVAHAGAPAEPDWLIASVVRFRPDVLSADFLTRWVADYEAGACSQAGGVSGSSTADIGDRTVALGTCSGGVRTYVTQLDDRTVVAATDLGPRQLGRELLTSLP